MSLSTEESEYVTGQIQPSHVEWFQTSASLNAAAADGDWSWDLPYGTHVRERFDLLRCRQPSRGVVLYLHAGYWQSRDKEMFRFIAPVLSDEGFDVALVNYPLCPEVSIGEIVASVAQAPAAVMGALGAAEGLPLLLCGHSAGAHLAVELALLEGSGALGAGVDVDGVIAISGVFDLAPLLSTSLNERLRLDASTAAACSPFQRVVAGLPPAHFLVGERETDAFQLQTEAMAMAWERQGNACRHTRVADADHFSILSSVFVPRSQMLDTLQAFSSCAR